MVDRRAGTGCPLQSPPGAADSERERFRSFVRTFEFEPQHGHTQGHVLPADVRT